MALPCVAVAMYPRMQPKQWKSGGGQQTMSEGTRPMRAPIECPLLRMEWCDRQAALGALVVPDVNWMLMMSSLWRGEEGMTGRVRELVKELRRVEKGVVEGKEISCLERWSSELFTRMTLRRLDTASLCISS
jgi:hypothetical protein